MDPSHAELVARVERLERIVAELHATQPAPPPTWPPAHSVTQTIRPRRSTTVDLRTWLRFIGIGLLLFGVVFLFMFSENESSFVHAMRVAIGVALGTGLVVVGRLLLLRDRAFAQVLTGGGIGVWYISGFAAHQLFALVPALPAMAYMTLVTLLAFTLSVRQNSLPLAIVATLGGLATPLLLHESGRTVLGVVVYVSLIATGAVAIHVRRAWSPLLWVAAVASGCALLVAQFQYGLVDAASAERWMMQAGITYLWALFAVLAAVSYIKAAPSRERAEQGDDLLLLAFSAPVYLIVTTSLLWNLNDDEIGRICLAGALLYTIATVRFFPVLAWGRLASAHFLVASGLATTGALLLLGADAQHVAIATEGLALRLFFRRTQFEIASHISHALWLIVVFLLLRDLGADTRPALPFSDITAAATLWSIAALAAAALAMPASLPRRVYFYAAHVSILGWILHQFSRMHNGHAVVTVVWGIYGAALLILGLRRSIRPMRKVGLLTLLTVVAKLFVVDLQSVPAIWRILLFIGFGGVFLGLSYWFMSLDRSRTEAKEKDVTVP